MAISKVVFNSVDFWEEIGAAPKSAPEFPIPAEIKELVKVKGATGSLTEATGYFNNIEMEINFRSLIKFSKIKDFWQLKRKINQTFNTITDSRLIFSEYPDKCYKVKAAEVGAVKRISEEEVDFDVNFICEPFLYDSDERAITSFGAIPYDGDVPNALQIEFTVNAAGGTLQLSKDGQHILDIIATEQRPPYKVKINMNPYAIATDGNGVPLRTEGIAPVLSKGGARIELSQAQHVSDVKIYRNARYLG